MTKKKDPGPSLRQIAARISAHLQRIEPDRDLNPLRSYDKIKGEWVKSRDPRVGCGWLFHSSAYAGTRYVRVSYVSYRGHSCLTKADALKYLLKLDHGAVGTHYELLKADE